MPPAFYEDGIIEVTFDRITGDFATGGPIYVYRYEYEEEAEELFSGPMAQEECFTENTAIIASPNPFVGTLSIKYQTLKEQTIKAKVYDTSGRLVKHLYQSTIKGDFTLHWNGDDEDGRQVPQGIYFIQIENLDSGEIAVHKVLKVR